MKARRRIERVREILAEIGLEEERIKMFNLSAAMAAEFVNAAQEMTETVNRLGRNPLYKENSESPALESEA